MLDNYRIVASRWWNKSTELESLYNKRCWWHSQSIALNCNLNKWTHANWCKMHFQTFQAYTQERKNTKSYHTFKILQIVYVALNFIHYNKMHPCSLCDFIGFWMKPLVPTEWEQWIHRSIIQWTNELHPHFVVMTQHNCINFLKYCTTQTTFH